MTTYRKRLWAYLSSPQVSVVTLLARLVMISGLMVLTLLVSLACLLTDLL